VHRERRGRGGWGGGNTFGFNYFVPLGNKLLLISNKELSVDRLQPTVRAPLWSRRRRRRRNRRRT